MPTDMKTGRVDHGQGTTTDTIAAELSVPERVLVFCLASDTDSVKAG
jgi:hypothetical protein